MTVLIVTKDEATSSAIVNALSGTYNVQTCTNSASVSDLLVRLQPQAMIIDISDLFDIADIPYRPQVIMALTRFVSDGVMEFAAAVGVSEVILMPCTTQRLAKRLDELLSATV